ncbi:transmembrane protein -like [Brachionus plicatilis]|uniref:Transmembrane protein-like n=1 Tax=Brachionus plicatilis TaxID=10195 RepID=A0A3M7S3B2_BRAPC|nr:transmembrane protein -like [Brachionus plicatilis]
MTILESKSENSDFDINKLANNYSNKKNSVEQNTSIEMGKMNQELISSIKNSKENQIDAVNNRFPGCIVWTPLPLISWFLPFIGHMGICYTNGVIRDFAGPYFVSEDHMGFGRPTRYWRLSTDKIPFVQNKKETWDRAVQEASDEYKKRMHNLICDNCHSHVAYALNLMNYDNSSSWNMVKLCFMMLFKGSFVNFGGFVKTWMPFLAIVATALLFVLLVTFLK